MIGKPSLLLLMAAVSGAAGVANGVTVASPQDKPAAPQTRLGKAIEQDLSARDAAAAKRKRALDMRERAAKAAENRLKAEMEARKEKAGSEAAAGAEETAPGAQFEELARIFQAMKPAKAAPVFEQLDMDVQMKVARAMRERSAAMLLAAMTPKGAAALSMALAGKKPEPKRAEAAPGKAGR